MRESIALLSGIASVTIAALYVSVDRMERGTGSLSALDELRETLGIKVYPIITVRDIIDSIPDSDARKQKMLDYLAEYGADRKP